MIEVELIFLLIFMIVGSLLALHLKDLLSSVIALGTVGLGLSLSFLLLQAPDIAAIQLVVEILCLVILVRATIQKDLPTQRSLKEYFSPVVVITFISFFIFTIYNVLHELPHFGSGSMKTSYIYIKDAIEKLGTRNIVSSIVLDFRMLDTLCEATILFTAVIGTIVLLRESGKKGKK